MAVELFENKKPQLAEGVFVHEQATVIGDVTIGRDTSVWPHVSIRGDMHWIRIGSRCSIQDGSVLHVTHDGPYDPGGYPLSVGDEVTVGHQAILHGCTIGNRVLVGMAATVLDGAVVEDEVVIAAGSLVPPGKKLVSGYLYLGVPCKQARALTQEEKDFFSYGANNYVKLKNRYLEDRS
jgi:carbonic anhydrase/acetyltransferase-like protein (isoleucine patch superfamily)